MKIRFLGLLFLICVLSCFGQTSPKHYAGPRILGPYDLDTEMPMSAMFDLLKVAPIKMASPICFRSTDGTYMYIERMGMETAEERKYVGGVLLSNFPNCVRNPVHETSVAVGKWKTKEGLGLGSTKKDVLRTYGKPSEDNLIKGDLYLSIIVGGFQGFVFTIKPKPDIGDEVFEYTEKDSLLTTDFGLRKGIIIWISISKDE